MSEYDTVYTHGIDKKGVRFTIATTAEVDKNDGKYIIKSGITACSKDDQFIRKEGIRMAKLFLNKKPFTYKTNQSVISFDEERNLLLAHLHTLSNSLAKRSVRRFIKKIRN